MAGLFKLDHDEKSLKCPFCGSSDTRLVKGHDLQKSDRARKSWHAKCLCCDVIYDVNLTVARKMTGALAPGSVLGPNILCPKCRYDLNTQEVGGTCPECGKRIPRMVRRWNAGRDFIPTFSRYYSIWIVTLLASFLLGRYVGSRLFRVFSALGIPVLFLATAVAAIKNRKRAASFGNDNDISKLNTLIRYSVLGIGLGLILVVIAVTGP